MSRRGRTIATQAVCLAILGGIIYFAFIRSEDAGPLSGITAPGGEQTLRGEVRPQPKETGERKRTRKARRADRGGQGDAVIRSGGTQAGAATGAADGAGETGGDVSPSNPPAGGPRANQYSDTVARISARIREAGDARWVGDPTESQ